MKHEDVRVGGTAFAVEKKKLHVTEVTILRLGNETCLCSPVRSAVNKKFYFHLNNLCYTEKEALELLVNHCHTMISKWEANRERIISRIAALEDRGYDL